MHIRRRRMRIDKQDARAGKTGVGLRYVLVISMVLAVVAMAAVYLGAIR
jgi:hypothetical protein